MWSPAQRTWARVAAAGCVVLGLLFAVFAVFVAYDGPANDWRSNVLIGSLVGAGAYLALASWAAGAVLLAGAAAGGLPHALRRGTVLRRAAEVGVAGVLAIVFVVLVLAGISS